MNARRLLKAAMRATRFMLLTFALQARAHAASASGNLAFNPARRLRGADGLEAGLRCAGFSASAWTVLIGPIWGSTANRNWCVESRRSTPWDR